jgi:hypothetical protein
MWQDIPSFIWDSYGSMSLSMAMQAVSEGALRRYSNCYCVASGTKMIKLKGVQTIPRLIP